MSKRGKGSRYERDVCKQLSLWWTDGKRDDVFWRTPGSGGRSKVRGRKGVGTYAGHGDVAAVDPIGEPLTRLFTIEIKRGYNVVSVQDFLELPAKTNKMLQWIRQAKESAEQAGSITWLLIVKRDKREPIVVTDSYKTSRHFLVDMHGSRLHLHVVGASWTCCEFNCVFMSLSDFLVSLPRRQIHRAVLEWEADKDDGRVDSGDAVDAGGDDARGRKKGRRAVPTGGDRASRDDDAGTRRPARRKGG